LPRLAWPLAAVLAYSLSVVDMALVLGPGTPPTVAVLAWRWLADPDPAFQAQGAAAALVLLVLWALLAATAWALWRGWAGWHRHAIPSGHRVAVRTWTYTAWRLSVVPWLGVGAVVVALLVLWSVAEGWFFPTLWPQGLTFRHWQGADSAPLVTTLWLATAASAACLPVALVWLEWGPQRANALLYLPLVLPALPLAAGQYATLLYTGLDGTATGLLWAHLLWVLPYTVLTLVGPYRALDPRLITTARALGLPRWQACLRVKWPLLLRPIWAAAAVGFAVSVAQYLPTQFAGGGRFATVTTEAVNLSAGGNRSVLALQSLLQVALPLAAFALAAAWPRWATRHRLGVR
jgi:putative thiamine transport system permease protein